MFYTIQSIDKWNHAKQVGYLEGNKEYINNGFLKTYKWMIKQMQKRLPKYKGEYPIWLWTSKDLESKKVLIKENKTILLEVNIPEEDVLLSDTETYQMVLNDLFVFLNKDEYIEIEENPLNSITKEESWERIFDLDLLRDSELWNGDNIQGVTGRIDCENIKPIK